MRGLMGIAVVPVVSIALAACGGSKPAYCSDRSNLEKSVKGLTDLTVSGGLSGLEAQLNKIKTNSTALVTSAKSDFPNETTAIKSSFDALSTTVKGLSNPTASDIATVAAQTSAFVTSVKSFMDATSSKCG